MNIVKKDLLCHNNRSKNEEYEDKFEDSGLSGEIDPLQFVNQMIFLNGTYYQVLNKSNGIYLHEMSSNLVENPIENFNNFNKADNFNDDMIHLIADIQENPKQFINQTISVHNKNYVVLYDECENIVIEECSNQFKYICLMCNKQCTNASALTRHYNDFHNEKVHVCRKCPKFFKELTDLFLHGRRDHNSKPPKDPSQFKFHCTFPDCKYMTNNGGTFEHHQRAHTKEKPYECDLCGKRFAQKTNRNTHRSRHNKEKKFSCHICNKQFKTHDIYLSHLETREHELRQYVVETVDSMVQIVCLGCNEILTKVFDIKTHMKSCNIKLENNYKCLDCNEIVKDLETLMRHLKTHKDTMLIRCPICDARGFDHMNKLNHHISRTHMMKVVRKQVCRYCEDIFYSAYQLREHIKQYHSNEINSRKSRGAIGRIICQFEGCSFTANTEMHMLSHLAQHNKCLKKSESLEVLKPVKKRRVNKTLSVTELVSEEKSYFENEESSNVINNITKRKRGRPPKQETLKNNNSKNTLNLKLEQTIQRSISDLTYSIVKKEKA